MRKLVLGIVSSSMLLVFAAMPAAAAHGGEPTVIVMQHLCNADIQSEEDFVAVEDAGAGGQVGGEGTLPGLVATVLACPTVFLPDDTGTGGIAADPTPFDYTVTDSAHASYALASDGMFMAAQLCESDINLDADGNGEISAETCLDVSMYSFEPVAEGDVTISQTAAPGDTRFGTIRFTPGSTDEMTVTSVGSTIELDTTADTQVDEPPLPLEEYNDDVVVVHVYNFQNVASTMPNAAMEAPASTSLPLTLFGFGLVIAAGATARLAVSRRRA